MAKRYNFSNIRSLLLEGFTDEELRDLCFDVPDFRPVYHQLARSSGKDEIVRRLLEHVDKVLQVDELLRLAKERNPARYEQHQLYFTDFISLPEFLVPETILIAAGPFLMGSPEAVGEWQQHQVSLPNYEIGKYLVTNEQYAKFVEQHPERRPQKAGWRFINPPPDKLNRPVVGINWYDALNYCQWLSQQTSQNYRLPTEAEWEKAARNVQDFHLINDIREWTNTLWGEDWRKAQFTYPYQNDERENLATGPTYFRIHRGGVLSDEGQPGYSVRGCYAPDARDKNLGFRVALKVEI